MKVLEIIEAKSTFARKGKGIGRKYRCTSGPRKGRVVAKQSTCYAPKKVQASNALKRTKARHGARIKVKRRNTMRQNARSRTIQRLNPGGPTGRRR